MSTSPETNGKHPETIGFKDIVSLKAAQSMVEKDGILLETRALALHLLVEHDLGIEGHNYGEKNRRVIAVVRTATPVAKEVFPHP